MKTLLFMLMFTATLCAENYPHLFAQLGTPLYKTEVQLQPLAKNESLKAPILDYCAQCSITLEFGKSAEQSADNKEKTAYLKKLRGLQEGYGRLTVFLQKQLSQSMKNNDYPLFLSLVNTEADLFFERSNTKEEIYRYYKKHKSEKRSAYLDRRIKRDEQTLFFSGTASPIVYTYSDEPEKRSARTTPQKPKAATNKVIVISRPGCSYCRKAKDFLNNRNISYTEYNFRTSSEGKRLFRKYNGTGVPLIIINGKVIRGFSAVQMKQALQ